MKGYYKVYAITKEPLICLVILESFHLIRSRHKSILCVFHYILFKSFIVLSWKLKSITGHVSQYKEFSYIPKSYINSYLSGIFEHPDFDLPEPSPDQTSVLQAAITH